MTTGAEPKKIAVLTALAVLAGVVIYYNFFKGDPPASSPSVAVVAPPAASSSPATQAAPAPAMARSGTPAASRRKAGSNATGEFKPRQGSVRPEDAPDPATIDPTLRLDLLAKVQNVEPAQTFRNVFQYGTAPKPAAAAPIALPNKVAQIPIAHPPVAPPPPPGPPPVPTAPPMTFKYYGYKISKASGRKQAFLLDGDDIILAGENDPVKSARYRVVTIGVNSITIEDTQFKSTQTLRLQEEAAG